MDCILENWKHHPHENFYNKLRSWYVLKEKEKAPGPEAATFGWPKMIYQDGFSHPLIGTILFRQAVLTVQNHF